MFPALWERLRARMETSVAISSDDGLVKWLYGHIDFGESHHAFWVLIKRRRFFSDFLLHWFFACGVEGKDEEELETWIKT
jgi:hypothetical protein